VILSNNQPPKPGSNYERYRAGSAYHRAEAYPIRPLAHAERYRPLAPWVGRLILPAPSERAVVRGVLFEVQHSEDRPDLTGRVLPLRWADGEPAARALLATRDVRFSERARRSGEKGTGHPERVDGWDAVDPLESLAAAHPVDDVCVALTGPVGIVTGGDGRAPSALTVDRQPLLVSGRYRGLVRFLGPDAAAGPDRYRVRHFDRAAGAFTGPEETVVLPETVPDLRGVRPATRDGLLSSPLNADGEAGGWYAYGSPDADGAFVVQAVLPRALLRLAPRAVIAAGEAVRYVRGRCWDAVERREGDVLSTLLTGEGRTTKDALEEEWAEGDRCLLLHVFGRHARPLLPGVKQPFCLGHFSFGIAEVVREPLSGELCFEITYHQVYAHNEEGVISGAVAHARYLGDRQFGFLGYYPVVDVLLKFDPVDRDYDIGGVRRSPLDEFARALEVMAARYRIGDGTGAAFVGAANNCSQDSNQTLYATLRQVPLPEDVAEGERRAAWARDNPAEAARLAELAALAESLRRKLFPLGSARADWHTGADALGSTFGDRPLDTAVRALLTWRTVLPRVAANTLATLFLEHGASGWVLGTSRVAGDPSRDPVPPLHFG